MKSILAVAVVCALFLTGCSKCSESQPPPPPAAPTEMPAEVPTEATTATPSEAAPEAAELPDAEQLNEELPPEEPKGN